MIGSMWSGGRRGTLEISSGAACCSATDSSSLVLRWSRVIGRVRRAGMRGAGDAGNTVSGAGAGALAVCSRRRARQPTTSSSDSASANARSTGRIGEPSDAYAGEAGVTWLAGAGRAGADRTGFEEAG